MAIRSALRRTSLSLMIAVVFMAALALPPANVAHAVDSSEVTSLGDSTLPGTLRYAMIIGGTITFAPGLTGTIVLTQGPLETGVDLAILGPTTGSGITITSSSSVTNRQLFNVFSTVTLENLTLFQGFSTGGGGRHHKLW